MKNIAGRIHQTTTHINKVLKKLGYKQHNEQFFDTLRLSLNDQISVHQIQTISQNKGVNFRYFKNGDIGISIDETTNIHDVNVLISIFSIAAEKELPEIISIPEASSLKEPNKRKSSFLTHPVFKLYHTETEMMRYIKRLDRKDISLAHSMISLGSCTMCQYISASIRRNITVLSPTNA